MNGVDPGLADRFRRAGEGIAWRRPRPAQGRGWSDRIAHLHDEEARIRTEERPGSARMTAEPGPVGALVLLLEIDRRGEPAVLEAFDAAVAPFAAGGLRATWGKPWAPDGPARRIPPKDLVDVARYALV